MPRWKQVSRFRVITSITGAIWALKGMPSLLDGVVLEGETRDQRLTITPFPQPGQYANWEPYRQTIETAGGVLVAERHDPLVSFAGLTATRPGTSSKWARGTAARSRALVSGGRAAEEEYRAAIELLSRTRMAGHLARARLSYGEWLRREDRRIDARIQLRPAFEAFASTGAGAFADRARRELQATGEKVRKRADDTGTGLTPQEEEVAQLAREGRTNPEIGAQLFIGARTVEWHLGKVFAKLGIGSRRELDAALSRRPARPGAPPGPRAVLK